MGAEVRWLINILVFANVYHSLASVPFRKFEYKFSFKPPYLAQKDGSVPFWEYGGNAIASSENVRIAPSLRSQKGAIWTKSKTVFDWWEVDIVFRITGRGRIGADGLAFWFVENKGAYDGQVFGSSDKWKGLGIFFDSFDNDNKHNNPYIMAVVNDGTKEFDHANDGGTQALAGCLRDFRNKPYPTRAKIEYYMNTLTVLFHNGMTNNEQDFEVCLRAENVHLPKYGYFGLSAATGGLADDHDVQHFLTSSLYPPGQQPTPAGQPVRVSPEEETKLTQEYAEYQRKLEHQKEEYKKEHPGTTKDHEGEFDDWYESDSQRELRQIFSGQSQIFEQVRSLSQKLDEMIGRQERTMSLISSIQTGAPQIAQQGGVQQPIMTDSIRRHEVDAVLQNQNNLLNLARELRNYIVEVHTKAESIMQAQARAPTAQVQSLGYDTVSLVNELKDGINGVKREMETVGQRMLTQPPCATNCVSMITLLMVAGGLLIIIFLYSLYRYLYNI
ncbi:hypothetical protein AAG570_010071 [Ranatra chinensis]|uniref:L-type lectin-like domain-containing protein n=1 Tax=Ranatra chinensis TaxID=642074 RepID=A0ABD0Z7N6_9HEMI